MTARWSHCNRCNSVFTWPAAACCLTTSTATVSHRLVDVGACNGCLDAKHGHADWCPRRELAALEHDLASASTQLAGARAKIAALRTEGSGYREERDEARLALRATTVACDNNERSAVEAIRQRDAERARLAQAHRFLDELGAPKHDDGPDGCAGDGADGELALGERIRLAVRDAVAATRAKGEGCADIRADQAEYVITERDAALERLRAAARALVEALPKCDVCPAPATRAWARNSYRYCDVHDGALLDLPAPEYPRAAPLRALLALLGAKP